jgi:hypothetical protein
MAKHPTRRHFLGYGSAALAFSGHLSFLRQLPSVSAQETRLKPEMVRLRPEIEPLVQFLEDTPSDRLIPELIHRIKTGRVSYQELLAALLLAGVRNVQPRPHVGYKFHTVLVVNSCHLASISGPDSDRWLPILWAVDYFKRCQAQDVREGDWFMRPVDESRVPGPERAKAMFVQALENWDAPAADAAIAGLVRTAGAAEVFDIFFRYGARDYRSIGHKAIFVANGYRTLQCIGWHHAEPVCRSLAYALLNHYGEDPIRGDHVADRPWKRNRELCKRVRPDWPAGVTDQGATRQLVTTLRTGSYEEAANAVVDALNRGVGPASIWDGLFTAAMELVFRQPGIVSLHAVTTTNAIHQAYLLARDPETRLLLMLQNASFLPLFRSSMAGRGAIADRTIFELQAGDSATYPQSVVELESIFEQLTHDRSGAVQKAYRHLVQTADPYTLINTARRLVFLKGDDPHDYKFSSAALEDYFHIAPQWRHAYLALSLLLLPAAGDRDNPLIQQIRTAFAS